MTSTKSKANMKMDRSQSLGTNDPDESLFNWTKDDFIELLQKDQISISKSMELTEGLRAPVERTRRIYPIC